MTLSPLHLVVNWPVFTTNNKLKVTAQHTDSAQQQVPVLIPKVLLRSKVKIHATLNGQVIYYLSSV